MSGGLTQFEIRDLEIELRKQFDEGSSRVFIDILSCTTGGTLQQMYTNSRPVRGATIQNITTTAGTLVSLVAETSGSSAISGSATIGILLNPGSAVNTGGGSYNFPNGDLSSLKWTATNSADKIAVAFWVSGYSGIAKPGTLRG